MKFFTKQLKSGLWAIRENKSKKCVLICNRAYNAHLIATILEADEDLEATQKVGFRG